MGQNTAITYHLSVQSGVEAEPAASPAAGIVEMTIEVDGRDIHAACAGTGGPTVLFEQSGPSLIGLVAEVIAAVMDPGSWATPVASPTA